MYMRMNQGLAVNVANPRTRRDKEFPLVD